MSKQRRHKQADDGDYYSINVAESMRAIGSGAVTGPQARVLAAIILEAMRADGIAHGLGIPADIPERYGLQLSDFAQVADWTVDDLIDGCRELYAAGLLSTPMPSVN